MCYSGRESDEERKKEAEERLKRMLREREPDKPKDDDTGLIVFDMEEKEEDSPRKEQELT